MTNHTPHGQVPEALQLADEISKAGAFPAYPRAPYEAAAAELRRLHAQVAALTAAPQGAAYAALPEKYYLAGGEVPTWDAKQMHAFADATHALRTTPVQNPAEIEHVAGDVSKNGAESDMAQQPAPSAASKAVLAAIRAANMQLVRTGDDEFMLVTYKNAKAQCDGGKCGIGGYCDDCPTPQTDSQPAPVLDECAAFETALRTHSGFMPSWIADKTSNSDYYWSEVRGMYWAWKARAAAPTPPAQAADSVLEDAALLKEARDALWQPANAALCERIDAYLDAARKQGGANG